jgi:uncharacterized protein
MPSVPPPETARRSPPGPPEPSPEANEAVGLWLVPASLLMGLGLALFLVIVIEVVASGFGASLSHPGPAVDLINTFVFELAFVIAALYFARGHGFLGPEFFGFRRTPWRRAVVWLVVIGVGYYLVTLAYAQALNLHTKDKLPRELGVSHHTAALVAATVYVCVAAPIMEEFFFRGFLFGVLRRIRATIAGRDASVFVAAVIVGIVFACAHIGSAPAADLLVLGFLGFVLCILRWRTGSLYPCMALHSLNNSLALGVNQEHWNAPEILALMAGALAAIWTLTGSLAARSAPR